MKTAPAGLKISERDWETRVQRLVALMDNTNSDGEMRIAD